MIPENQDIETNELIIKYLSNNFTTDEVEKLKNIISTNPTNKGDLEEYKTAWLTTALYHPKEEINESAEAWNKIKGNIVTSDNLSKIQETKRIKPLNILKIAAIWITMMGIGALIFYLIQSSHKNISPKICEIRTPLGSRAHITLPDSSEVWLNADTRLSYPETFEVNQRDVYLSGEAYFKVKSNKKRPFVVHASDVKIKALGTIFNVKAYPDDKSVVTTLVEGVIKFEKEVSSRKDISYTIMPKSKLTYNKAVSINHTDTGTDSLNIKKNIQISDLPTQISIAQNINTVFSTSWKDSRWVIHGEKLDNLAILLERRYDVKINLLSRELSNYKFSGIIENETLEQVLKYLKLAYPIKFDIGKGYVNIRMNENLKDNYTTYLKKNNVNTN